MGLFKRNKKKSKLDVYNNNVDSNYEDKIPKNIHSAWYPRLPKMFRRTKIVPKEDKEEARNLSAAFYEHLWNIDDIMEEYPDSKIDKHNIQSSKGLFSSQAADLLTKNGPNALPKPKEISDLRLFVKQFMNFLWILLLVTDALNMVAYISDPSNLAQLWVSIIIFVMIVGMCCLSFMHEKEARKVVRGFANLVPENCIVIRDGKEHSISSEDLVVGDLIWIKNGTKVPADARLLHTSQLKLETSSITGEAEPIEYDSHPVNDSVNIFDSHNVAFNGSYCVDGEGIGIVIRTGTNTVIGQIADLTLGQKNAESKLEIQMKKFVIFLTVAASILGLTVFIIGGFVHKWKHVIRLLCDGFLVCAIGMVPCGMPATVASIIALVARRMAKKNVFLKRLDIVEALGSVNIIASDKTGTLTKNIMTVTNLWYYDEVVDGHPSKKTVTPSNIKSDLNNFDEPINDIIEIMTVCNASKFMDSNKDQQAITMPTKDTAIEMEKEAQSVRPASGAPSEVAMLIYVDRVVDIDKIRGSYKIVFEIPFNSKRKWHLMIAKLRNIGDGQAEYKLFIKGAPEILIQKCSHMALNSGTLDLTDDALNKFQNAYESFGANGRRVIGFCHKTFTAPDNMAFDYDKDNVPIYDLTFAGMCAIMDPPRDESAIAIQQCRSAGIKVFMVTGDHYLTAEAIAREIKLIEDKPGKEKDYEILHGEKISNLTEQEWDNLLKKNALVFARTTPEQKLLIVEQCQKRKQVIAMTGDGVNDSPALKKADIGIAMGSGSDVAKQAADVILMDDNFASIVKGVQEGRMMFDNIKKVLAYNAIHSTSEVWPIIINFCFGLPVGVASLQILAIDLGTEIMPGIAMAKEPMEGDLMKRPPRRRDKVLISNGLLFYAYTYAGFLQSLGCFLAYCCVFWYHGINIGDLWMSAMTYWQEDAPDFVSKGNVFSWQEQLYINRQACSAWHMGIVFGQIFHLLSVRTRRQSIFTHGLFRNWQSLASIVVSLIAIGIFVYCPGINKFIGGAPINAWCWLAVAVMGVVLFIFCEIRKYFIRKYSKNKIVRVFKW